MAPKQFLDAMTLAALLLAPAVALAEPPHGEHGDHAAPAATAHEPAATAHEPANAPALPSPEEANNLLVDGNERFVRNASKHPRQSAKRVSETAAAQHPFATVLSCSDSRVPPELVFDEGLGDVFSVRVAGNVASPDELGSVEYGVEHLGTPLLVVMGHTKCGFVTAAATHTTVHGHLPPIIARIGPAVDSARAKLPGASDLEIVPDAIKANVFESMATVLRDSESVRERVDSGKTRMIGAVYDVTTGTVTWLGPHPEQNALVARGKESAPAEKSHGSAHDAPKNAHASKEHDAPKHGDAGAEHGKPDEAHAAKDGHDAPAPLPVPAPPNPISFAVLALICTIGGGISGRLSK